ncbi:MAG: hypothetical protein NZR01_14975 [Bryobacteraceae bacterium]|nr:hypothetical protein [Bryobacteraceae bacterium]
MRFLLTCFLLLAAGAGALSGQRIAVFSEFQRPRPDGEVCRADRAASRREILSPALVRNGWASFLFTVEAPAGEPYTIYIAQNPDNTAKASVYQLEYRDVGGEWVPDGLKPAPQPVQAVLDAGQVAQAYLLDLFLPASAPVERFRLEIQLHAGGRWTIYPMEMRPMAAVAPAAAPLRGRLAPVAARADETVALALRDALCGADQKQELPEQKLETLRAVILRNALQDLALAPARQVSLERIPLAGGWPSPAALCKEGGPAPRGPEWWLRVRGHLFQGLRLPEIEPR